MGLWSKSKAHVKSLQGIEDALRSKADEDDCVVSGDSRILLKMEKTVFEPVFCFNVGTPLP